MNLLKRTPEQMEEMRKKASESKKARTETKTKLKNGTLPVSEVLNNTKDKIIGGIKVSQLIHSLPKVGKKKAEDLLIKLDVKPDKKLSVLKEKDINTIKELIES